eukprot:scaffold490945_cov55-Attheya_sp.AAC.2
MSHWMTSGASRLRAKQSRTFGARAQQWAASVGADQLVMTSPSARQTNTNASCRRKRSTGAVVSATDPPNHQQQTYHTSADESNMRHGHPPMARRSSLDYYPQTQANHESHRILPSERRQRYPRSSSMPFASTYMPSPQNPTVTAEASHDTYHCTSEIDEELRQIEQRKKALSDLKLKATRATPQPGRQHQSQFEGALRFDNNARNFDPYPRSHHQQYHGSSNTSTNNRSCQVQNVQLDKFVSPFHNLEQISNRQKSYEEREAREVTGRPVQRFVKEDREGEGHHYEMTPRGNGNQTPRVRSSSLPRSFTYNSFTPSGNQRDNERVSEGSSVCDPQQSRNVGNTYSPLPDFSGVHSLSQNRGPHTYGTHSFAPPYTPHESYQNDEKSTYNSNVGPERFYPKRPRQERRNSSESDFVSKDSKRLRISNPENGSFNMSSTEGSISHGHQVGGELLKHHSRADFNGVSIDCSQTVLPRVESELRNVNMDPPQFMRMRRRVSNDDGKHSISCFPPHDPVPIRFFNNGVEVDINGVPFPSPMSQQGGLAAVSFERDEQKTLNLEAHIAGGENKADESLNVSLRKGPVETSPAASGSPALPERCSLGELISFVEVRVPEIKTTLNFIQERKDVLQAAKMGLLHPIAIESTLKELYSIIEDRNAVEDGNYADEGLKMRTTICIRALEAHKHGPSSGAKNTAKKSKKRKKTSAQSQSHTNKKTKKPDQSKTDSA